MKVAVAGVGAMGTRFALKLKQAGNDVTVVDGWDERVAALKKVASGQTSMAKK